MGSRASALTLSLLMLFGTLVAPALADGGQPEAGERDHPPEEGNASFPVTIDGLFDDWESIPVVYADPAGDGTDEDFSMLKIANDNDFMFFSIEFHDGEHLMQNWNDIHLYLDTDAEVNTGLPVHGIGAELDWCFGCRSGYFYIMDGIIEISQNDLTLRIAPTITGERFEIAISRSSAILTMDGTQEPTTIKIVLQGGGETPDILPDEPGGIEYEFDSTPVPSPEIITLEKNEMEHLRILSYNVRQNGLFDSGRQAEFERIIKALEPDIMGFQEAYDDNDTNDVNDIEALFEDWFPEVNWHVSSEWNGNFVVSRYPILHQGNHSWRSMGVLLDTEEDLGTPLFFINSHFSCCDANDNRQEQVDELMSFVRDLKNGLGPFTLEYGTPIVHVGDFNLVGYRQQLTTLTDGDIVDEASYGIDFLPDWDDSPLTDLFSRQTHIRMGYTWRSDNSEWNPGKLDYILYTDSVLEPVKHFVLNTLAMSEEDLSFYNLNSKDTKKASDHLPRVMDIAKDPEEPTWVWSDPLSPQDDDIMGNAHLDITGTIASSSNITATWYANVSIRDDYGTDLLPDHDIGVRAQIDQHLGDGDGWLSIPEIADFVSLVETARNLTDSEDSGCCVIDYLSLRSDKGGDITVIPPINGSVDSNGSWGWIETTAFDGTTDGRSTRILDIPRVGGVIEEIPLRVTLPGDWEFRYSAMLDIIEGSPNDFTVFRQQAPVASDIRITLGQNQPPDALSIRQTGGSVIPLSLPAQYSGECRDSVLDDTQLWWTVHRNGTMVNQTQHEILVFTASELGFSDGEVATVNLHCLDSFSASGTMTENIVIDGVDPTWEGTFVLLEGENSTELEISEDHLEVPSGRDIDFSFSASDVGGLPVSIEVASDKSEGWSHAGMNTLVFTDRFFQGGEVNGMHLNVTERHQAKEPSEYYLSLTVTDDASNQVTDDWTITISDGMGPTIIPDIIANGTSISPESPSRAGDLIILSLTESFDDLDAIDDVVWEVRVNEEKIAEGAGWADVEKLPLPITEAGVHLIHILAWDTAGNMEQISFGLAVSPERGVYLSVLQHNMMGDAVEGETVNIFATLQNTGTDLAAGMLCSDDVCSDEVVVSAADSAGPGVFNVELVLELTSTDPIDLRFEWTSDSAGMQGVLEIENDYVVESWWQAPMQVLLGALVVLMLLAWGAHRLWGPESQKP